LKQVSEYEERQILMLARKIDEFKNRRINLKSFISDQWSLLDLLESTDPNWIEEYRTKVNELEYILAVALDSKDTQFSHEDQSKIVTIIDNLETMLKDFGIPPV
jgi:hypothetical protein